MSYEARAQAVVRSLQSAYKVEINMIMVCESRWNFEKEFALEDAKEDRKRGIARCYYLLGRNILHSACNSKYMRTCVRVGGKREDT